MTRCSSIAIALLLGCTGTAATAPSPPPEDCEWCGAPEAPASLTATARLTPPDEPGERLVVRGTVYARDGKTPAADVLLYAYQTNAKGVYPRRDDATGNARRHGALRGWMRTGADGRYEIITIRPGSYPGREAAAHIHMTVTPPGGDEYWIDDIVFDTDPFVTDAYRAARADIGGSGIVTLEAAGDGWRASRDIILAR